MTTPTDSRVMLPVMRTIANGYREVFRHGGVYTAIAVVWAAVVVALDLVFWPLLETSSADVWSIVALHSWLYPPNIAFEAAAAMVVVPVYRSAILLEAPAYWMVFRISARELRVFGLFLLVYAASRLEYEIVTIFLQQIGIPSGLFATFDAGVGITIIRRLIRSLIVCFTVIPFVGLALPLAAIDARPGLIRSSIAWSRGNLWRIGAIVFLSALPLQIIATASQYAWPAIVGVPIQYLHFAAYNVIYLWALAVRGAALGLACRMIADRQGQRVYEAFD
jgi:hypothetical protein